MALQQMYSKTLKFIFKIKQFLVKHLMLQKCANTADVPGRFASTGTASAVELLSFSCSTNVYRTYTTNE